MCSALLALRIPTPQDKLLKGLRLPRPDPVLIYSPQITTNKIFLDGKSDHVNHPHPRPFWRSQGRYVLIDRESVEVILGREEFYEQKQRNL